jgi:tRNA(Ile2) C34 agmatinyltransferase TiaS
VPFDCPGCGAPIDARPDRWGLRCPACRAVLRTRALDGSGPERWGLRCPACRAVLRTRAIDGSGPQREIEVEVTGRPETRRRLAVPWTADESRRLRAWLAWSTVLTLGLVAVLYALARWG